MSAQDTIGNLLTQSEVQRHEIARLRAENERLQATVHELEDVDRNLHDMRVARDAEIERLRAENVRLEASLKMTNGNEAALSAYTKLEAENERLRAENERLQAKVHELEDVDRNLHDMRVARDAEIERLRTTLRMIVDVDGDVFQFWWEARDICRRALGDKAP